MIEKIDSANILVKAEISNDELEKLKEKKAREIAKQANIPGFRKGKLNAKALERKVKAVKKLYAGEIEQEAINAAIQNVVDEGLKEAGIDVNEMIAQPEVTKFDRKDDKIEVEIKIYKRPDIEIDDKYKECVPEVELPEITEEAIEEELNEIAKQFAETKVSRRKTAKKGDIAVINFTGYIDGEKMENGSGEDYPLELGSGSFIPGFEEQIEGMKVGETKKIKVTFPENYGAKEIAGKEAEFEVTLQEIQEKVPAKIDDELAKKYMNKEDATLDELKEYVKDYLLNRLKAEAYEPKKAELLECLVKTYEIDLPEAVVEKEVEVMINEKAREMTPAQIKELQENPEKVQELRDELLPEAKDRVKLTFLIDEIAKKEGVVVSDEELTQVIYYEALMQGQNPADLIKYYQENNILPVLKMNLVENKLLNKLLDEKAKS